MFRLLLTGYKRPARQSYRPRVTISRDTVQHWLGYAGQFCSNRWEVHADTAGGHRWSGDAINHQVQRELYELESLKATANLAGKHSGVEVLER